MISEAKATHILQRYERYEKAREQFDPKRFKRGGGYTPQDVKAIEKMAAVRKPSNEELGELEYYGFMTSHPEHVFAYYKGQAEVGQDITNWMGHVLGRIVHRGVERRPMGGRVVSVHVAGANGISYVGTCNLSSGNYCRLRRRA
jgi:hypothetical protein